MSKGAFAAVINCMDGRTQIPVINYIKNKYNVDYVDSITEPGPIKFLSEKTNPTILDSIKNRAAISVNRHGSKIIGIVGHHDCAGNPVNKSIQLTQIERAVATVKSWGFNIEIIKLWVNENWTVEEV